MYSRTVNAATAKTVVTAPYKQPKEARVLWRTSSDPTEVISDRCWAYEFHHHAACDTDIVIKAGNKEVCLENYSADQNTRVSELLLKRRYR